MTGISGSDLREWRRSRGWDVSELARQLRRAASDPVAAEATGLGVPTVVLPFVNTALASRAPFRRSVESLRAESVKILLGPGGFQPHPPRTGGNLIDTYPWHLGLDEAERMLDPAPAATRIYPHARGTRSDARGMRENLRLPHPAGDG